MEGEVGWPHRPVHHHHHHQEEGLRRPSRVEEMVGHSRHGLQVMYVDVWRGREGGSGGDDDDDDDDDGHDTNK